MNPSTFETRGASYRVEETYIRVSKNCKYLYSDLNSIIYPLEFRFSVKGYKVVVRVREQARLFRYDPRRCAGSDVDRQPQPRVMFPPKIA